MLILIMEQELNIQMGLWKIYKMKSHEFYRLYANTPLGDRHSPINFNKAGLTNLNDVYKQITEIEDKIRPDVIKIEELLRLAREYYYFKKSK